MMTMLMMTLEQSLPLHSVLMCSSLSEHLPHFFEHSPALRPVRFRVVFRFRSCSGSGSFSGSGSSSGSGSCTIEQLKIVDSVLFSSHDVPRGASRDVAESWTLTIIFVSGGRGTRHTAGTNCYHVRRNHWPLLVGFIFNTNHRDIEIFETSHRDPFSELRSLSTFCN